MDGTDGTDRNNRDVAGGRREIFVVVTICIALTVAPVAAATAPGVAGTDTGPQPDVGRVTASGGGVTSIPAYAERQMESKVSGANGSVAPPNTTDGPVPENATVYVGATVTLSCFEGESNGNLYAVDPATGTVRWNVSTGCRGTPTVVNGTVFLPDGGQLRAVDATDGTTEWTVDRDDFFGVGGSPTVVGGTVYAGEGRELYAVDAATGAPEWNFSTGGVVRTAPNVVDDTIFVGTRAPPSEPNRGYVHAVDADTGEELWSIRTDQDAEAAPTAVNGTVYIGANGGNLSALDIETGAVRWTRSFRPEDRVYTEVSAPTVVNGTVYVRTGTDSMVAVDAATGEIKWRVGTGDIEPAAGTVTDNTVYFRANDGDGGTVQAVDTTTGAKRWEFKPEDGGRSVEFGTPTVAGGVVYVTAQNSTWARLYLLDAVTGQKRRSVMLAGPTTDRFPAAADPTVVADPDSGRSVGSRVLLGTLGHHGSWARAASVGRFDDDAPVARFSYAPTTPDPGDTVVFDASATSVGSAGNASNVTYQWTFGDGATATGKRITREFDERGNVSVTLAVSTDEGTSRTTRALAVTSPGNVSIESIEFDPNATVPAGVSVEREITATVNATVGVERVVFAVAGDEYVDRDGSDGWTAAIPLDRYDPGATVQVRAEGATDNDTAVRDLGIAPTGGFIGHVIQAAAAAVFPDKVSYSIDFPPPVAPDTVGFSAGVVSFDISAGGGIQFEAYLTNGGGVDLGGTVSIDLTAGPVGGEGSGLIEAQNSVTERDPRLIDVDRVRGVADVSVGLSPKVGVQILGYGVTFQPFYGPFFRLREMTWNDPAGFPLEPDEVALFSGSELSGEVSTDIVAGELKGEARGRLGGDTSFPDALDELALRGRLVFEGIIEFLFKSSTFTYVIFDGEVAAQSTVDASDPALRRHEGTVPLAADAGPDADNVSVSVTAATNTTLAATQRLTRDGYADQSPTLATTESGYLLAWDRQAPDRSVMEGHDLFVRPANASGDFTGTAPTRVTNDSVADGDADLASNGSGGALLAWTRLNRSFAGEPNTSVETAFAAQRVAVATGSLANGTASVSTPTLVDTENGTAFRPQVGYADGRYYLAWRYEADGNLSTRADRGVRYATYDPTNGLGPVTTLPDARAPRLAGARLAYFRPDVVDARNGTVVVRNLSADTAVRTRVQSFTDVAVTPRSTVWVDSAGPNATVQYRGPAGTVDQVATGPVGGVRDVELTARRTTGGDRVDVVTFRGRTRTDNGSAGDLAVFYRVRAAGGWAPPRRLTGGAAETDLTFAHATTAGRQRGFAAVVTGENVSEPAEQPDLFAVAHEYGRDLNVSASASPTPVRPGESVTVTYNLRNDGARTARNVTLRLRDDTGSVVTVLTGATLAPGDTRTGSVTFAANRSRTVTVAATSDGTDLRPGNDAVNVTVMRPNLTVAAVDRRRATGNITYRVRVRNAGPVGAANATLRATNNGETVAAATFGRVGSNATATATIRLAAGAVDPTFVTRLRVADAATADVPADGSGDVVRIRPPLADAFVIGRVTGATVAAPPVGGANATVRTDATLSVLVGNRGSRRTNATVTVRASDGSTLATRTVRLPAGTPAAPAYRTVSFRAAAFAFRAGQDVTIRVATGRDATPGDNAAGVSIPNRTAADLFARPVTGSTRPMDPDRDGLYEDVDGDGRVSFADVVALFEAFDRRPVRTFPATFDFNGNGRLDFADLVALFEAT
jgi:outer membrane protein assembly factor BamB